MRRHLRGPAPEGQVLVIALAAMIMMLLMLGLAIDGGRGYWERRQAQNAAEHAALAGAWESCHNTTEHGDWEDAARDAAADNGFVHNGTDVWVTPTNASGVITVIVRSRIDTSFSGMMGFETIGAEGRAVADCTSTSGEGFALFAGGDNCDKQIEFAGQTNTINGAMHSNGNIHMSGGPNTFNGAVTYVDSPLAGSGSGNTYNPSHAPTTTKDWPGGFKTLADYAALAQQFPTDDMHYDTAGNINTSYIVAHGSGLYYSKKKIDVGSVGSSLLNVTLVSEEEVIISGSDLNLQPYIDNLLAFSGANWPLSDRCGKEGVILSGSNNDWKGFIYAPLTRVKLEGSTNNTLIGSVIAWNIYLSGQALNNTADPSFLAGPPVLRLIE